MHEAHHENRDAPGTTPAPADRDSAPAEPAPAQPRSSYQLPTKKNTVLRNMLWALVLTLAVVVVVGIAFFGVGSDLERSPLENSEVDVAASAERAQELAPFPVAVPQMDAEWTERSARFTDGENPRWTVEYTTPQGRLVTLVEESEVSAPLLAATLPGSTVEEELTIEGAQCQLLRSAGTGTEQLGMSCEGDEWGFITYGAAERAELEELATATVTAIG